MLVHVSEIKGKGRKCMAVKMRGRKCMRKETEGRKIKVRGRPPPPPPTGGQEARGGAKGLCARCQGAAVESVWAASK